MQAFGRFTNKPTCPVSCEAAGNMAQVVFRLSVRDRVKMSEEPTNRAVRDVTAINVEPALGERLYKAAVIQSHQGTTVRVLSKTLASGKIDVVHYACDLDPDGTPQGKRRIHRITAVAPE